MSTARASSRVFASLAAGRRLRAMAARLGGVGLTLLLAACATTAPQPVAGPDLFDDAHFAPPREPLNTAEVFRMSPAMRAYFEETIKPMARQRGARRALLEAVYQRGQLQLEYESSITRNASEAFEARQGNCLSLVLMTGAFAQALDLRVTFQEVGTDEMWSRSGGLYFMSGHVNLMLEHRQLEGINRYEHGESYTIDFLPGENPYVHARPISEKTVLAMYMNNRAAEALVVGKLDDAYWRLREALRLDPGFASAYNTLGVVYLHRDDVVRAERVFRHALAAAPENSPILSNEIVALQRLGRDAEAQAMRDRLVRLEPTPPFYWFMRGQVAMRAGDFEAARTLFLKEIARAPDYHEFHFALAVADFNLGRLDEARRELTLAQQDAVKRSDQDLYAAKLDRLRGIQRAMLPQSPTVQ